MDDVTELCFIEAMLEILTRLLLLGTLLRVFLSSEGMRCRVLASVDLSS